MVNISKLYMVLSILLSVSCIVGGLYINDLTWCITSSFGLCILLVPHHYTKKWESAYNMRIMGPLPFILAAFVISAFSLGSRISMFSDLWTISIILQAWALMICGYMTMIVINNHMTTDISRRWMLVYSMLMTCTIAGLYAFYTFTVMYYQGYPVIVSNDYDFMSNWYLMKQMTITLFFSIFYAAFLKICLKGVPRETLNSYNGGKSDE